MLAYCFWKKKKKRYKYFLPEKCRTTGILFPKKWCCLLLGLIIRRISMQKPFVLLNLYTRWALVGAVGIPRSCVFNTNSFQRISEHFEWHETLLLSLSVKWPSSTVRMQSFWKILEYFWRNKLSIQPGTHFFSGLENIFQNIHLDHPWVNSYNTLRSCDVC